MGAPDLERLLERYGVKPPGCITALCLANIAWAEGDASFPSVVGEQERGFLRYAAAAALIAKGAFAAGAFACPYEVARDHVLHDLERHGFDPSLLRDMWDEVCFLIHKDPMRTSIAWTSRVAEELHGAMSAGDKIAFSTHLMGSGIIVLEMMEHIRKVGDGPNA